MTLGELRRRLSALVEIPDDSEVWCERPEEMEAFSIYEVAAEPACFPKGAWVVRLYVEDPEANVGS